MNKPFKPEKDFCNVEQIDIGLINHDPSELLTFDDMSSSIRLVGEKSKFNTLLKVNDQKLNVFRFLNLYVFILCRDF